MLFRSADDTCVVLIHPKIAVTKECVDAAAGEPITFSGTVTNTGDVLLVDVTVTDDHGGPVLGPIDLAPGASAPYSGSYTPTESPSTNTVTAEGTASLFGVPDGKVTATASDTCQVFGCALSPGFWKGGEGRGKWDQLEPSSPPFDPTKSDPIAMAAGFATFTRFPWLAAWLDNSSYLDVMKLPTRSDVTIQLGFKYIAARLNLAAFGAPTGVDTLLDEIDGYLALNPVGSEPSGAAKTEGQRLLGLLNNYFSTVGEAFCPATGDVPEL